jgi:predicted component of type VI protein secretion system
MRIRNAWRVERLPTLVLPVADSEPMPLPLRIGRDLSSGLRLSDSSASRVHAELRRDGETWTLRDLGSMNGTFVNGRRVMGAVVVRPGDQVTFGRMSYRLAAGQA